MSYFPTTRLGRAVVLAVVVSGVAVVLPFLVAVLRLKGDVMTELPPLEPEGTPTAILMANPVAWFLAVGASAWLALAVVDVVRHLSGRSVQPARRTPPRRPVARTATRSPARAAQTRKPSPRTSPSRKPQSRTTQSRKPQSRTPQSRTTQSRRTQPRR